MCIVCRARQSVRVRRGRGGTGGVEQLRAEWQAASIQQLAHHSFVALQPADLVAALGWQGKGGETFYGN